MDERGVQSESAVDLSYHLHLTALDKTKAEALAAAMGVRLKEVYSARESGVAAPIPGAYPGYYVMGAEGPGEITPPPVAGQNIEIRAAVEITYVIE
ncbi:hypothetical protein HKBW3S43_00706 [Candidatus Hakubella thermalkaliphila]|uniref:26 kDa periplasmic immunogenic protein n=1 Tax=Candidatus Hakubella thermalkaliphila TaxID=2754717 RepID=A0A6V8NYJ8_9ACTN|nr:hypothetical protein HKBW3S25_00794 [Candidatus Hakubella thermalkaliphila]GFP34914.1 hypothetical protein HKBW3S43_00706 [Candidatus Hakubella thermalkaliphila]